MSTNNGMSSDFAPRPKTTPPGSLIELPPSPPYTEEKDRVPSLKLTGLIPRFLHELNAKPFRKDPYSFRLSPGSFTAAETRLKEEDLDFWGELSDKLRFDLIDESILFIRMPTTVHELLAQKLSVAIQDRLKSVSADSNHFTQRLIEHIDCTGSANVRFTKTWWRSPDQQFKVKSIHFPGVVIEVAYTQTEKDLTKAAKDYIRESYGQVQMVICIKLDPRTPRVRLSTLCPILEREGDLTWVGYHKPIDGAEICDKNGEILSGSLKICLRDFASQADLDRLHPGAEFDKDIIITYQDIVDFIRAAEAEQMITDSIPEPPQNTKKRPYTPESSAEELDSADEREYKRRETNANEKAIRDDDDYRT